MQHLKAKAVNREGARSTLKQVKAAAGPFKLKNKTYLELY